MITDKSYSADPIWILRYFVPFINNSDILKEQLNIVLEIGAFIFLKRLKGKSVKNRCCPATVSWSIIRYHCFTAREMGR